MASSGQSQETVVHNHWREENFEFTWIIPDFVVTKESAESLADHGITFGLGHSIALPVTFDVNLLLEPNEEGRNWVCVYFRAVEKPQDAAQVMGQVQLTLGDYGFMDSGFVDLRPSNLVWRILPQDEDLTRLPLTSEGALPIQIRITLHNSINPEPPSPAAILVELETRFQAKFQQQLKADMEKSGAPESGTPVNVRVVSMEGKEFTAQASLLAARSPVLRSIWEEGEVKQGVWKMRDMRGNALEVFLHFLHRAELKVTWKELAILKELVMAAKKYQLKDLLEFLDEALELLATPENCGDLILLANAAGLKKAKRALLGKYREMWKLAHNPELLGKLLNGFCSEEDTN